MTSVQSIDEQINLNVNPYNIDPFIQSGAVSAQIIDDAPNKDKQLSQKFIGLELMDTRNLRQ